MAEKIVPIERQADPEIVIAECVIMLLQVPGGGGVTINLLPAGEDNAGPKRQATLDDAAALCHLALVELDELIAARARDRRAAAETMQHRITRIHN